MVITELSVAAPIDTIYSWYSTKLTSSGWRLSKTERVGGSYNLFTRGDSELFEIQLGNSTDRYITTLASVPAACATRPPTKMAFVNCG